MRMRRTGRAAPGTEWSRRGGANVRRNQCAEQRLWRPHCARAGSPPRCRPMGSQHPPLTTRAPPLGEAPRPGGRPQWQLAV